MRPRTKVIATVLVATTLGAGVSLAAGGPSAVYTACYKSGQPNAGWVKLINQPGLPTSCSRDSVAFSFNEQGQPGATGPAGATGATGPAGPKGDKGDAGASSGPQPSQFRNFTVTAGPENAPCVLARAASPEVLVITYEATDDSNRGLALYTSPTCGSDQLTPRVRVSCCNTATNSVSQETFTPGFTVPADTALYSIGSGFVNGYVTG